MRTRPILFIVFLFLASNSYSQKIDSSVNRTSAAEHAPKDSLTAHENILTAKTANKMYRIDKVNDTLRFTLWIGKKTYADIPDLVLNNGNQAKSDAGGITWTFKNGPWTYIVEDDEMTGDEDAALFLMTYRSNVQVESERCTKTK